jgi:hypothetical protein
MDIQTPNPKWAMTNAEKGIMASAAFAACLLGAWAVDSKSPLITNSHVGKGVAYGAFCAGASTLVYQFVAFLITERDEGASATSWQDEVNADYGKYAAIVASGSFVLGCGGGIIMRRNDVRVPWTWQGWKPVAYRPNPAT